MKTENIKKLKMQVQILKGALIYCANHARPSIVKDVAKGALKNARIRI